MSEALPEDLATLLDAVWTLLEDGVARRSRAANRPTLATVDAGGAPQVRALVLRGADRGAGDLVFFTDAASAKIADLTRHPRAAVHLWDEDRALQVRLTGAVRIVTGAEADGWWESVPPARRDGYGIAPLPGTPIAAPFAYDRVPTRARFAVLVLTVGRLDVLHLGERHRRAVFERADVARHGSSDGRETVGRDGWRDGWRGGWRAP